MPATNPSIRQESVVVELAQRCNHDCPHCYNVWKNRAPYPAGELDTSSTIRAVGKLLDETGASRVSLSGGEPLLRDDFLEILGFLNQRGVTVNLITNGSLLDGGMVAQLTPNRISVFELPLLSARREIHDRMSGRPGAFDRVTLAIAELKAARQVVVAVFVATRLNLPFWRETAELAVALGLDGIMFNRFNPGGSGGDNIDLLQAAPDEIAAALDAGEELSEAYEISIACSIAMPPCLFDTARYKRLTFGFCAAGTSRAYYTLDPLGNVRPCNHSPRILGNILTTSFSEVCASDAMKDFMSARPQFCLGCSLETTCQGGCKAAAEACCGDARAADPFLQAFQLRARRPA